MKRAYKPNRMGADALKVVEQASAIAQAYRAEGDDLTLRQLYYQFVARALVPNHDREYKRLGRIINDARYAGLFDWSWITDVTRNVAGGDGSMTEPIEVIEPGAYWTAFWEGQTDRVEVWVEKDALARVVARGAGPFRVPYFSCRGYTSSSELKVAANRIEGYLDDDVVERVHILHLGDHDPSGIDMTRDIEERLATFLDGDGVGSWRLNVNRIALNMDQVQQYGPPPNPAKTTDSRYADYIARFGTESWELDALEPRVIRALIATNIESVLDRDLWDARVKAEQASRTELEAIRDNYDRVREFLIERDLLDDTPKESDTDDDDET